jgi:hypothetical protein
MANERGQFLGRRISDFGDGLAEEIELLHGCWSKARNRSCFGNKSARTALELQSGPASGLSE